jgi:cardiolipin synthase
MASPSEPQVTDRVLTLPNALSALRLLGVPLFLWFMLGPHADLAAFAVLVVSGISDYLDGKLARAWRQVTRIGQLLDPLADRLYTLAIVVAFVIRDVIPWWLAAILVARDVMLAITLPVLRYHGWGPPQVHFLGKAATFNLLLAFPIVLLGTLGGFLASVAVPIGWAFMVWGTALYWWSALLYVVQTAGLVRDSRRGATA